MELIAHTQSTVGKVMGHIGRDLRNLGGTVLDDIHLSSTGKALQKYLKIWYNH